MVVVNDGIHEVIITYGGSGAQGLTRFADLSDWPAYRSCLLPRTCSRRKESSSRISNSNETTLPVFLKRVSYHVSNSSLGIRGSSVSFGRLKACFMIAAIPAEALKRRLL